MSEHIDHEAAKGLANYIIAADHGNEDALTLAHAYLDRDRQVRELAELVTDYEMLLLCRGNRKELADVQAKLARILGAEDGE